MKSLLIILALLISAGASAQQPIDEITTRVELLESMLTGIGAELEKSHKEFKAGVFGGALGAVTMGVGALIEYDNSDTRDVILIAGGAVTLTGIILMIDSHKHIARAGRLTLSPRGIAMKF
jgi:hypothetical protein